MAMFREIADIQISETLNLPTPDVEKNNIAVESTQIQQDMVKELGERAENIRAGLISVWDDNMLAITNEGRKLALDQRLINPNLPDDPNSKVNTCIEIVYDIWEKTKDKKSTQLIFCDLSTPKLLGTMDNPYELENDNGVWKLKQRQFTDIYTDIKRKLIEKGIPEDDIAFIHEATTEAKKEILFDKVRTGEKRILMGSTFKMGAGTNVQDKIIALHNLDCPWTSANLIQRIGRAVRQGNENDVVKIFNYVTKRTFDAYMYQLIQQKQEFISQIMTSKTPIRSMEDIDERALDYAEIKALATGDEHIKEKTELEAKTTKLKMLKQSYLNQKYELEELVQKTYPSQIKEYNEKIEDLKQDKEHLERNTIINEDNFSGMILDDKMYNERTKAGERILNLCQKMNAIKGMYIGEYRGFKMYLEFDTFDKVFKVALKNKRTYKATLGNDKVGVITRINNVLETIEKDIEGAKKYLQNLELQLRNAQETLEKPFEQEKELQETMARLKEVNKLLKIGKEDKKSIVYDEEDIEESDCSEKEHITSKEHIR